MDDDSDIPAVPEAWENNASKSTDLEENFASGKSMMLENPRNRNRKRDHPSDGLTNFKRRNRETTKDRLLEWLYFYTNVNFGIWIQCTKCNKWRKEEEYQESHEVPKDWDCSMRKSGMGSCEEPEDVEGVEFSPVDLVPGSIVWAKLDGYPWWPGMIEDDPDIEEYYYLENQTWYYNVTFLDEKVTHAWVPATHVRSFTNPPLQRRHQIVKYKNKYDDLIQAAEKRAKMALSIPIKERFKKFSFAHRFKGKWPAAKDFDHESTTDYLTEMLIQEVEDIESIKSQDSGTECISDSKSDESEENFEKTIQIYKHGNLNALKNFSNKKHKNCQDENAAEKNVLLGKKKTVSGNIKTFKNTVKAFERANTDQIYRKENSKNIPLNTAKTQKNRKEIKLPNIKNLQSISTELAQSDIDLRKEKENTEGKVRAEILETNEKNRKCLTMLKPAETGKNKNNSKQENIEELKKNYEATIESKGSENKNESTVYHFPDVLYSTPQEKISEDESKQIDGICDKKEKTISLDNNKKSLEQFKDKKSLKTKNLNDEAHEIHQGKMITSSPDIAALKCVNDNPELVKKRTRSYDLTINEVIKTSTLDNMSENSDKNCLKQMEITNKTAEAENKNFKHRGTPNKNLKNDSKENIFKVLEKNLICPQGTAWAKNNQEKEKESSNKPKDFIPEVKETSIKGGNITLKKCRKEKKKTTKNIDLKCQTNSENQLKKFPVIPKFKPVMKITKKVKPGMDETFELNNAQTTNSTKASHVESMANIQLSIEHENKEMDIELRYEPSISETDNNNQNIEMNNTSTTASPEKINSYQSGNAIKETKKGFEHTELCLNKDKTPKKQENNFLIQPILNDDHSDGEDTDPFEAD